MTEERNELNSPSGSEPLQVTIPMETLLAAIEALDVGWEYSREALWDHEIRLGRTTRRNLMTAEMIEADQEQIFRARGILRIYSPNAELPDASSGK